METCRIGLVSLSAHDVCELVGLVSLLDSFFLFVYMVCMRS
jgi:hypothetical protein